MLFKYSCKCNNHSAVGAFLLLIAWCALTIYGLREGQCAFNNDDGISFPNALSMIKGSPFFVEKLITSSGLPVLLPEALPRWNTARLVEMLRCPQAGQMLTNGHFPQKGSPCIHIENLKYVDRGLEGTNFLSIQDSISMQQQLSLRV